jgi:putative (di)nucleoside polyphosphate hydrolase
MSDLTYRPCVGVMLLNRDGLAFIGRRRDRSATERAASGFEWQMPQGGIDPGEDPLGAAQRELSEETGVTHVSLLARSRRWLFYDLPEEIAARSFKGQYRGQKQKWFAFRFEGAEDEINVLNPPKGIKPEFDAWRWEHVSRLPDLVIPFKKAVYEQVVEEFSRFARGANQA